MNELNLQNPDLLNLVTHLEFDFETVEIIIRIPVFGDYIDDCARLVTHDKMLDKNQCWKVTGWGRITGEERNNLLTSFYCLKNFWGDIDLEKILNDE
jgi:hypothetical protein